VHSPRAAFALLLIALATVSASVPALIKPVHASRDVGLCGSGRWDVKTLADAAAPSIDMRPIDTTVRGLAGTARPAPYLGPTRVAPVETSVFRIDARLIAMKTERDGDVHLIVGDVDHADETLIAEFPATACTVGAPSPDRAAMFWARDWLRDSCGIATPRLTRLRGAATITGVGFFDYEHGQYGVAPNAVEVHPVLRFISHGCTATRDPQRRR
jgi:hypothetical protein